MTGSIPGIAASTSETWVLGAPPNAVEAPENSFELEVTWAWISMPITTSQSPVAPFISLPLATSSLAPFVPAEGDAGPIRGEPHHGGRRRRPADTNSRRWRDRPRPG